MLDDQMKLKSQVCQAINLIKHSSSFEVLDPWYERSFTFLGCDKSVALTPDDMTQYHLPAIHETFEEKIKMLMHSSDFFSITTDSWTDLMTRKMVAITAHFYPRDSWDLQRLTFDVAELSGSHTSINLREHVKQKLEAYPAFLASMVVDGALNKQGNAPLLVVVVVDDDAEWCFAHQLHLVCLDTLRNHSDSLESLRTFIKKFKTSVNHKENLRAIFARNPIFVPHSRVDLDWECSSEEYSDSDSDSEEEDFEFTHSNVPSLILDVKSRWRSTFLMLERFLLLSPSLDILAATDHDLEVPSFLDYFQMYQRRTGAPR